MPFPHPEFNRVSLVPVIRRHAKVQNCEGIAVSTVIGEELVEKSDVKSSL
jgi:hypothetical protein